MIKTILACFVCFLISSVAYGESINQDLGKLREQAEQGGAEAQFQLGLAYGNGKGVKKDDTESARWYAQAAVQGHPGAQNNLGVAYRLGRGVQFDLVEAFKWFGKSAEQNYATAQYNLGYAYENGQGVTVDLQTAKRYYKQSSLLGYVLAKEKLNDLESLHEEIIRITVPADGFLDSDHQIFATIFRPDGDGPFPLLVLSHGNPPVAEDRKKMGLALQMEPIREFVKRGYVVISPVRRGFGVSGGYFAENYERCTLGEFYKAGLQAARDILATLAFARTLPYVKPNSTVLAGQSAGGFASVAAASLQPKGVSFVLNFSGGRGGNPSKHPTVPCGENEMPGAFAKFGTTTQIPVLFHYVENDQFFGPKYTRSWFAAFEGAGGKGKYVLQAPFGKDGHGIIGNKAAVAIWTRAVDDFILSMKMN